MGSIIEREIDAVRTTVGPSRVICALSGGVDSAVAAALVHRAIGHQLTCIYVDTGLMRLNESAQVVETFRRNLGLELIHVDAGDRYFERLVGVTEPEQKRKIIGELFVRIFEEHTGGLSDAEYLVQGTLYPDVIESGGSDGTAAVIKSHHNVGGLPDDMTLEAGRAAAQPVQGRGPPPRHRARSARRDRVAPAVPRPGSGGADHRRGDPRTRLDPATCRCDRA